ncbi:MAG: hypothetical protein KIG14_02890, partial [Candidatus Sacchiramonaceae bacterium]|nr:hypothetical protein [Candidatus Saccharimonadaceae bacterium]
VLVLAIAGLIFLMVFIALPTLQRSQRDTQRKNDLGRVVSAVQSFKANNRGQAPRYGQYRDIILPTYLKSSGDDFKDPDGSSYRFNSDLASIGTIPSLRKTDWSPFDTIIYVFFSAKCTSDGSNTVAANPNETALMIVLESGGIYCANA